MVISHLVAASENNIIGKHNQIPWNCDLLPNLKTCNNLEHQLSKSGIAPALMYGEAQAAESRADFIHKMKMLLKELRETRISLRIINEKPLVRHEKIELVLKECNELVGIFTKSVETARKNRVE